MSEFLEKVTYEIGWFFYAQEVGDDSIRTKKAVDKIIKLRISEVTFNNGVLAIKLSNPGLFIGHHGETIRAFERHIKDRFPAIRTVSIHEVKEDLMNCLLAFSYETSDIY